MRFKIPNGQLKLKTVITEHNGEEISWDTTWYVKSVEDSPEEIFREINGYLGSLPQSRQKMIFDAYRSINNTITDLSYSTLGMNLADVLIDKVKTLYDGITEDELIHWVTRKDSTIILPPLTEDYGDQPPDGTYVLSGQIGLVAFAMALRMMIPIWGEYIRNYSDESETGFKEYTAMRLMLKAWPTTSKHRDRLLRFIIYHNRKDSDTTTTTYNGVGSTEKPEWSLSSVCVRRLPVAPLSNDPDNPKSKLVSGIYNFVTKNTYNTLERKFNTRIKDKHEKLRRSPEDKTSFTENYKIKEALSSGDLATLCGQFKNPGVLWGRIDDSVPQAYYEQSLSRIHLVETIVPEPHQIYLMQFIMGLGMPATGVESLVREAMLKALVGTQCILWHWGFYDLAALVMVEKVPNDHEDLLTTDTKPRVPKEDVPKLMALYPHHQPITAKGNMEEILKAQKAANTAIVAIDMVTAAVGLHVWRTECPEALLSKTTVRRSGRNILAPSDLKIQLSSLIMKINEKSKEIYLARKKLREQLAETRF